MAWSPCAQHACTPGPCVPGAGTEDALALASGMAAISTTLLTLLSAGDHMLIQARTRTPLSLNARQMAAAAALQGNHSSCCSLPTSFSPCLTFKCRAHRRLHMVARMIWCTGTCQCWASPPPWWRQQPLLGSGSQHFNPTPRHDDAPLHTTLAASHTAR